MADQDGHRLGGASPQPGGAPPQPGAPPQGGQFHATGKKITVDFAEARQALKHLEEAYIRLHAAYEKAEPLTWIENPGREQPSKGFAGAAKPIGHTKRDEIANQRDAVQAMYRNLKAQLDSQQRTEQANTDDQRRAQG